MLKEITEKCEELENLLNEMKDRGGMLADVVLFNKKELSVTFTVAPKKYCLGEYYRNWGKYFGDCFIADRLMDENDTEAIAEFEWYYNGIAKAKELVKEIITLGYKASDFGVIDVYYVCGEATVLVTPYGNKLAIVRTETDNGKTSNFHSKNVFSFA